MNVLTIAGFDPTGGAGILRDISIFNSLGIPYNAIPTSLTIQTHKKVISASAISLKYLKKSLSSLNNFCGVKIGMLYNEKVVKIISDFLRKMTPEFVVLDPVINSSSGYPLISKKGICEMKKNLIPISDFITPNLEEGKLLTGKEDIEDISKGLHSMGVKYVIITGIDKANDLFYDGEKLELIKGTKMNFSFHGSGCFYSSYLLGELILGAAPLEAVKKTKKAIETYIKTLKSEEKNSQIVE